MFGLATGRTMTSWVCAIGLLVAAVAGGLTQWLLLRSPYPAPPSFVLTSWSELVPRDWDPLTRYRRIDLSHLDDADPKTGELLRAMREAWTTRRSTANSTGAA